MRFEFPPTPLLDYFSSEDVPLLGDFLRKGVPEAKLHRQHDHSHPVFEVAQFPETPMLPDCSDDEFSEFVDSPGSEVPPKLTEDISKDSKDDVDTVELADLVGWEYTQHVAIILAVQLFIPIPFMLPMAINFAKRSIKVLVPGYVIASLCHLLLESASIPSIAQPFAFNTFFSFLKISALGGIAVGAIMSHVLNFFILGHTVCRLVRKLDPQPITMRRAMDRSKAFQCIQRLALDLITGVYMVPAGYLMRRWFYEVRGLAAPSADIDQSYATMIGMLGCVAVQVFLWMTRPSKVATIRPAAAEAIKMSQPRRSNTDQ